MCTPTALPPAEVMNRLVWINVGELSGDIHAADLLVALQKEMPGLTAVGMGGPALTRAGQRNLLSIEALSVMGIAEVLSALPRAVCMLSRIRKHMETLRPRAVILVDAPEFNFRVARIARRLRIPVYYYIPPKVWAWRTGRVEFLRHHVRHLLCILPFETDFYARRGLAAEYTGNPLAEQLHPLLESNAVSPVPNRIGLMPGSRRKEIRALLPEFGRTARILLRERPNLEFYCLRAPNMSEEELRSLWPTDLPVRFELPENRHALMQTCRCIVAASGTAVLETALLGVPTVIAYRVSRFSALVGRLLIKVPWVGLPNLILNREVFPELLQDKARGEELAAAVAAWLDSTEKERAVREALREVRRLCGPPGCAARAAVLIAKDIPEYEQGVPAPVRRIKTTESDREAAP